MTTITDVDPDCCPLCGQENGCGMRAGSKTCWCFSERLLPGILERVPSEARHVACLCKSCATGRTDLQDVALRIEKLLAGRR
ncbi:MAG: cysteine-rich CWC family protein [Hyphomicrobium sp.]|nr:cysteine-rich CWC family protein [Hyphomicrobium sp.]